jgi:translation initiation factor 1
MGEICEKCGLNKALCVCETIAKSEQKIRVMAVKRRFGKMATIIDGIEGKDINLKDLAKRLKEVFACGGTVKEGAIELQGNHVSKVKQKLIEFGFAENAIRTG